ncbi:hypothetical protein [Nocardioides yefusunii]|uniref:Uncharacterized protein n=1 Tax=Nocardioides yefusunii TaxID=2500546 RepID=A0ABW1QXN9_9ACTN|nr:hypothetical protein [Nocardioides yefusunii]
MLNSAIVLASSEEAHAWGGADPYWVGATVLVIMLGMIGALIAFGNGREHS